MNEAEREIAELAAGCILAVERVTGVQLDYTQDTLPILDHYLGEVKDAASDVQELVAAMSGAYFGEVVRRTLGPARWHLGSGDPHEFRLEFEDVFLSFSPVGIALEAIAREEVEGSGAHFDLRPSDRERVRAALELFGDTREDDYYRFGVRYEAIEQAVHTLATLEMQHTPRRKFDAEAYARFRRDRDTLLH
ncbi:MAG: hypothetical protein GXY23_16005 [Myxococcales bacterium]|jgi:hypothetical protein|nr:hypothetical protein [Myxococcales bacterium]